MEDIILLLSQIQVKDQDLKLIYVMKLSKECEEVNENAYESVSTTVHHNANASAVQVKWL